MARFFVPPEQLINGRFTLAGSEAHHARDVLRLQKGDDIDLFDGKDLSYRGRIEEITEESIHGVLLETFASPKNEFALTLCQGLLKGPKWDWLIEKACEVGVDRVVPLLSERTVVQVSRDSAAEKVERWSRIALAASKQSGRPRPLRVDSPVELDAYIRGLTKGGFYLIPWEKENSRRISEACDGVSANSAEVFIGPEGGWSETEVRRAAQKGAIPVRLGPTLLRSETAGIVAATLVLREFRVY